MTQAADDLRLLKELAEEIKEHGYPGLPGGLRRLLRTERAKVIGEVLEVLAREVIERRSELARLRQLVHHLRTDIELTTDALLVEEGRRYMQETKKPEYDPNVPLFSAEGCKWDGKSYGTCKAAIVARFERDYVTWLLAKHRGNLSAAAKHARMDRKHLLDLALRHGVRRQATLESDHGE